MSYAEMAETAKDPVFIDQIIACGVEQALIFVNDARPEFKAYAEEILSNEANARRLVWPVTGQPGITVDSPDPDILAAVQSVWPLVGASSVPPA